MVYLFKYKIVEDGRQEKKNQRVLMKKPEDLHKHQNFSDLSLEISSSAILRLSSPTCSRSGLLATSSVPAGFRFIPRHINVNIKMRS